MRDDVIYHRGGGVAASAGRVQGKEGRTGLAPFVVIAALCGRRSVGVVPGVPGAGAVDLTRAAAARGHQTATGTGAGWCWHQLRNASDRAG